MGTKRRVIPGLPMGEVPVVVESKARTANCAFKGWSRHRRIVILRRRVERPLALTEHDDAGQLRLSFAEIDDGREVWEYAVLVTSLDSEILSLGQALSRPRR
jgi:hypothetical protein